MPECCLNLCDYSECYSCSWVGIRMSTSDAAPAAAGGTEATEVVNHLKRKSSDIGWEWARLCDPNDKNKVKCLFCGQETSAGINRLKQHLAHKGTSIVKCPKVPEEVKEKCIKNLDEIAKKKKDKQQHDKEVRENVQIATDEEEEVVEIESIVGSSSTPKKLGPMDKFTRPIDPKLSSAEAKRQQNINEALWKERTHQVQQYVAKWVYTHGMFCTNLPILIAAACSLHTYSIPYILSCWNFKQKCLLFCSCCIQCN